jgi:hypothetical protein
MDHGIRINNNNISLSLLSRAYSYILRDVRPHIPKGIPSLYNHKLCRQSCQEHIIKTQIL